MKKLVLVLGLILLMAGTAAQATELAPLPYVFSALGTPVDNTFKATTDNTAQSIQTLAEAAGITWTQNGQTPHGILLSVETQDVRIGGTGTSASGTVGHVLAVGSVTHFAGAPFIQAMKLTDAVANTHGVVQITLER